MNFVLNGKARVAVSDLTVADLLRELELATERLVVEHNARILRADDYADACIGDGDKVEIVRFVAGG